MMRQISHPAMNSFCVRWSVIVCLLFIPGYSSAQKNGPTYLWGIITSGCNIDEKVTSAVEFKLKRMAETVVVVKKNPTAESCFNDKCAELFQRECPTAGGHLIGGTLTSHKLPKEGVIYNESTQGEESWHHLRIWKVNLSTRQSEIREHLCNGCKVSDFVARHAAEIMEQQPAAQRDLGCKSSLADASPEEEVGRGAERLILLVASVSKEQRTLKSEILDILKRHIRLTGRNVSVEERKSQGSLLELRSRNVGRHLLELSLKTDGAVQIRFLEQNSADSITEEVECFGCSESDIAHRVKMAVSSLLDRCVGERCKSAEQSVAMHRSASVCARLQLPTNCEPASEIPANTTPGSIPVAPQSKFLTKPCANSTSNAASPLGDGMVQHGSGSESITRRNPYLWSAGWTLVGLGVAGLAVMGMVFGLERQSSHMTCQDTTGSFGVLPCQMPLARTFELTSGLVGGGLAVTGAVLLGFSRRAPRPSTR